MISLSTDFISIVNTAIEDVKFNHDWPSEFYFAMNWGRPNVHLYTIPARSPEWEWGAYKDQGQWLYRHRPIDFGKIEFSSCSDGCLKLYTTVIATNREDFKQKFSMHWVKCFPGMKITCTNIF